MNQPIFQSIGQALSFSYLVQAFEASPESVMGKEMRKHMAMLGDGRRSTIDFGGLNPLEIRGQCAMIREMVVNKLPKPESDSIKARYGIVLSDKTPDGKVAIVIPEERREAIVGLAGYLHPQFDGASLHAISWMISRAVGNVSAMRPSYRSIAVEHGGSASTLSRIMPKLVDRLNGLELSGIDRLIGDFERDGLILSE